MDIIVKAINTLITLVQTLSGYVIGLFRDIADVGLEVLKTPALINELLRGFFPSALGTLVVFCISLCGLYIMAGRN